MPRWSRRPLARRFSSTAALPEAGDTVVAFLGGRRIAILDLVFLTHRHADHLGGLRAVVDKHGTRMFLDAPYPHEIQEYDRLLALLEKQHVPVRQAERGRTIDLGEGARLTLLGPPEPPITDTRSDVNANSVVSRIDFGKVGVLFAADAEAQTERWLLDSQANLRAAVLEGGPPRQPLLVDTQVSASGESPDRGGECRRGQRVPPPRPADAGAPCAHGRARVPHGHRWTRNHRERRWQDRSNCARTQGGLSGTMTATENMVFVDEVEDLVGRLVLGDQVFHLPRVLLPADAHEGQWLRISIALTPAPPDNSAAVRKRLGESDPGGDISL